MSFRALLLGCGHSRDRRVEPWQWRRRFNRSIDHGVGISEPTAEEWRQGLVTVDDNKACAPDLTMDLNQVAWLTYDQAEPPHELLELARNLSPAYQFRSSVFDEVHAYEVLEHLGTQGDAFSFFAHFEEIWRILKDGGLLCATVPSRYSQWLWGDPGHRRVILPASLTFLSQAEYARQLGKTAMSDYRNIYHGDFHIVASIDNEETHTFVLQALK